MGLRGQVFQKQLFSSDCFALFIDTFLGGTSGIINGCTLSNTANSITINEGYFCIKGRFLQETGTTVIPVESSETDLFCKLVCEIDLSKINTVSQLNQAYYKILQDESDYPELQQDDITVDLTGIYQFEFAQFKITSSGITNFMSTGESLDFTSIYAEMRQDVDNAIAIIEEEGIEDVQALINRLEEMLQQLEHDMIPSDLVVVNNVAYSSTNLNAALTEISNKFNTKANNKLTWTTTLDTTWTGATAPYTKTISLEGMLSTYVPVLDVIYSSTNSTAISEKEEFSKISKIESGAGEVTITCFEDKPSMSLNVRIEVVF